MTLNLWDTDWTETGETPRMRRVRRSQSAAVWQPAPGHGSAVAPLLDGTALCAQVGVSFIHHLPPDTWHPEVKPVRLALTTCHACPLRRPCLQYALTNAVTGVWGGTTARERKRMRSAAQHEALEPVQAAPYLSDTRQRREDDGDDGDAETDGAMVTLPLPAGHYTERE